MLKQVMLGAGGVMLAAAIFASSVSPEPAPAEPLPETYAAAAPLPPAAVSPPATPRPPVFSDDSGDTQFGAPMIETVPVDSGDAAVEAPALLGADENGGRQFTSRPGSAYPVPR